MPREPSTLIQDWSRPVTIHQSMMAGQKENVTARLLLSRFGNTISVSFLSNRTERTRIPQLIDKEINCFLSMT